MQMSSHMGCFRRVNVFKNQCKIRLKTRLGYILFFFLLSGLSSLHFSALLRCSLTVEKWSTPMGCATLRAQTGQAPHGFEDNHNIVCSQPKWPSVSENQCKTSVCWYVYWGFLGCFVCLLWGSPGPCVPGGCTHACQAQERARVHVWVHTLCAQHIHTRIHTHIQIHVHIRVPASIQQMPIQFYAIVWPCFGSPFRHSWTAHHA